MSVLCDVTCRT